MNKKYIVRLDDSERDQLRLVIKKLSGSSQKVKRAQILLKADADGPGWTDAKITETTAEAPSINCSTVPSNQERSS